MEVPGERIPVPDSKVAQRQIPSNIKGITNLKTGIEGPGAKISHKPFDAEDAEDVKNDDVEKIIKKHMMSTTSKMVPADRASRALNKLGGDISSIVPSELSCNPIRAPTPTGVKTPKP